ncbi:MAG: serine--tRNA ligase [Clostridia bacterium]|nr:serine--tRNA ligase [Clostridia bacterium]
MLDINLIRENPKLMAEKLAKKGHTVDFTELLEWDKNRRELLQNVETKKAEKNKVSAEIPALKKAGQDVTKVLAEMKELGNDIAELDKKVAEVEDKMNNFLLCLPNVPDDDLLAGGKEANACVRTYGEKPKFDFKPKSHIELCEDLGLIDYERGAKLAGNGSWVYRGMGARLEWALLNFFIDEHLADGYEFMLLPHMLNYDCGLGAGQFPKFEDEVYWIDNKSKENKFLLPTAETALVNLYKGEVLTEADLPKKFAGFTPCYRREAGSYRSEERGMIRGHQFHKVEMVQYTTKEGSDAAFEELVAKAERLVQKLGLHYQLAKLAAGDCSASMCRTYDIEVWIPSMNIYKEVSSVSNARDYQARRNNTRYRNETTKKLEYVHTLNGSGLATTRIFPALLEQNQNADGSITIPEVLRKYMGGLEKITK